MIRTESAVPRYANVASIFTPLLFNEMVVVQLTETEHYSFNETFRRVFQQAHPGCAFAWVTLEDWRRAEENVKEFTDKALEQIGFNPSFEPPLGYYLFRRFSLVGFHPGQIDWERDKIFVGGGAIIGGIAGLFARSAKLWSDITAVGLEAGPASRMKAFFEECLEFGETQDKAWDQRRHVQVEVVNTEVSRAFSLLGLPTTATIDEVNAAYRRAVLACHPDKADQNDADAVRRANAMTAQLNSARKLLQDHLSGT